MGRVGGVVGANNSPFLVLMRVHIHYCAHYSSIYGLYYSLTLPATLQGYYSMLDALDALFFLVMEANKTNFYLFFLC
jgi:hypothetical protein